MEVLYSRVYSASVFGYKIPGPTTCSMMLIAAVRPWLVLSTCRRTKEVIVALPEDKIALTFYLFFRGAGGR